MSIGIVGAAAVVAGAALVGLSLALAMTGVSVSIGAEGVGGGAVTAGAVLLALGAAALAVGGPRPYQGRLVRTGLALVSVGLAGVIATAHVSSSSLLVVVYLLGGLTAGIGVVVVTVGLLRLPGSPRRLALTFGVAVIAAVAAGILQSSSASAGEPRSVSVGWLTAGLLFLSSAIVTLGLAGVGILALRSRHRDDIAVPG